MAIAGAIAPANLPELGEGAIAQNETLCWHTEGFILFL
jgi:hypothetical protein